MNETDTNKKTIGQMLGRERYRLEYYQREYVWSGDEIKDLAEDLLSRFDQQYARHGDNTREYQGYFLGTIITSRERNSNGNDRKSIIDGQQRLTTITLLLIHLDIRRKTSPESEGASSLDEFIFSKEYHHDPEEYNIFVQDRNNILDAFRRKETPSTEDKKPTIRNLIERNLDIEREFDEQALPDEKLNSFIDWILKKNYVVEISTGTTDDAYEIFTTVNDRGLGLTAAEMLKGFVLSKVSSEEERESLKRKWNETIDDLHRLASQAGNNQLKNVQKEEAHFFQSWIRSQYGEKDKDFMTIGSQFHRWIRNAAERRQVKLNDLSAVKQFVGVELKNYARSYKDAREKIKNYDHDFSSFYFNGVASFTLQYPLVLAAVSLNDSDRVALNKMSMVARYIEIMLARRLWARLPISHREMLPIVVQDINKVRECKDTEQLRTVLNTLLEEKINSDKAPLFSLDSDLRLHGQNRPTIKRLLARMTEWVQSRAEGDPISFNQLVRNSYHIEHLWGVDVEKHRAQFENDSEYQRERHRIGALVLIKSATNESLGGRAYEDKLDAYSRENRLAGSLSPSTYRINPGLRKFISNESLENMVSMESFGKKELEKRTSLYVQIAKLCWAPDF